MTNHNCFRTNYDSTDDDRAKALDRAKDRLIVLDKMRRGLELPPETLYVVHALYESALRDVTSERVSTEIDAQHEADRTAAKQLGLDPGDLEGRSIGHVWSSLLEPQALPRRREWSGLVRPTYGEQRPSQRISMPLRLYGIDGEPRVVQPAERATIVVMNPFAALRVDEFHIEEDAHAWTVESFRIGNREQLTSGPLPGDVFGSMIANKLAMETAQIMMDIVIVVRRHAGSSGCFKGSIDGDFVSYGHREPL